MNELVPSEFYLSQNYPNPFKEKTVIKYCVPYRTRVQLSIYDSAGEEIEKLVDEEQKAGAYKVEFRLTRLTGARQGIAGLAGGQAVSSRQLAKDRKAVPTNPTSSRCRDENHPGFSKAESGEQKAEFSRHLEDEEYVYRMEAGDYFCERKMIIMR